MSDEQKPDGPDYRDTKQIPAVKVPQNTLDAVLSEVKAMRAETSDRLEVQSNALNELGQRMINVEGRVTTLETARAANSMRAKTFSDNDLRHESQMAETTLWRNHVNGRLDAQDKLIAENTAITQHVQSNVNSMLKKVNTIHATVVGVVKHPKVIFVGKVIFALAVAYSGLRELKVVP